VGFLVLENQAAWAQQVSMMKRVPKLEVRWPFVHPDDNQDERVLEFQEGLLVK
jgi:hypothetical protein